MPEIAGGCRYVAPPELHDIRLPADPHPGFENGKGVNVTVYLTAVDAREAVQAMTEFREVLDAAGASLAEAGRGPCGPGGAMDLSWVVGDPVLRLDDRDVPHLGHTGIRVVLRQGAGPIRRRWPGGRSRSTASTGCSRVRAADYTGLEADIHLLSGNTADVTLAARAAAPCPDDTERSCSTHPSASIARSTTRSPTAFGSWLPATLDTDEVL
ncbi:MAG: hypothetical protein R2695_08510 [Acidimicrobiales bacterium]